MKFRVYMIERTMIVTAQGVSERIKVHAVVDGVELSESLVLDLPATASSDFPIGSLHDFTPHA